MANHIFIRVSYLWCFFLVLGFPLCSLADNFYDQHSTGWHWYDDPNENSLAPNTNSNNADPIAKMDAVKLALKKSLDQAVLNPTPQNVKNYIELQTQMSNRASRFSETWKYVLLQNPALDYSIQHPTNQVGREVYLDQLSDKENDAIKNLAQHSGLFFFYRSTCPYCQRFAPIVKAFSERYGIPIVPITTDGVSLPDFPNSHVDQGQAEQFHVSEEPALFSVDPYTHKAIPVSYGLTSEDDLRQRIMDIATNFRGDE